jgi:rubrerythrin
MDDRTRAALDEALDDEYRSRATYRAVLARFGDVRPFSNIVRAEQRHVEALLRIYQRYGIEAPSDPWPGRVEAPSTMHAACAAAADAERDNEAMYARLLAVVVDPHIRVVMQRLREASRDRHLPAFERCVQRGRGGPGPAGSPGGRQWE